MKLSRRCFLSFAIGAAAGINLTPLPWKLTDDSSIWTQMWPWTPVPSDGKYTYENTVCTLCPGGCGISVRKVDHRAVKIEGTKENPVNNGGMCVLGASGLQLVYTPARVPSPMKRIGERGEGKWKKISWSEAIAAVSEKLGEIRESGAPEKIAAICGKSEGTLPKLLERLTTVLGSPNFMTPATMEDSYRAAGSLMMGADGPVGFDFENTDYLLSFGSGLIEGWGSPVRMFQAVSGIRERGKVLQFEPRLSNTAAKMDQWIPIKPGTEAAMALGIAHILVRQKRYDKKFVDTASSGFKAFKNLVVANYSPGEVSEITGVPEETIVEIALEFAEAKKPMAVCGRGKGNAPVSVHEVMAVQALNALAGNIDAEGGVWNLPKYDYIQWAEPELDDAASEGLAKGRLDGAGSEDYAFAKSLLDRLPKVLNEESAYGLEALLVAEANPVYSMADSEAVKKAFAKVPFIVSFSTYMDETAQLADLILPNHAYLERYEDVPISAGLKQPTLALAKPVVKPQQHTMNTGDAIIRIAQSLGGGIADAFPWSSYEACLQETLGDKWDALLENVVAMDEEFAPNPLNFENKSGKFEFASSAFDDPKEDNKGLPHYESLGIESGSGNYTLVPYDSMRQSVGYAPTTPFMLKTVPNNALYKKDGVVLISPDTAKKADLEEGDYAELTTSVGSAKVKVALDEGVMPEVIAIPTGLGHTAYDEYMGDGKGLNVNQLLGVVEDPVTGYNAAWGIRAKMTKA